MKIYVIKRTKNIKSFLFLFSLFIKGTSNSILPASLGFILFTVSPLLLIIELMPLFADLTKNKFCSIDLKIAFA